MRWPHVTAAAVTVQRQTRPRCVRSELHSHGLRPRRPIRSPCGGDAEEEENAVEEECGDRRVGDVAHGGMGIEADGHASRAKHGQRGANRDRMRKGYTSFGGEPGPHFTPPRHRPAQRPPAPGRRVARADEPSTGPHRHHLTGRDAAGAPSCPGGSATPSLGAARRRVRPGRSGPLSRAKRLGARTARGGSRRRLLARCARSRHRPPSRCCPAAPALTRPRPVRQRRAGTRRPRSPPTVCATAAPFLSPQQPAGHGARASRSAVSTDSSQVSFTDSQSAVCQQVASAAGGIHSAGSLSALLQLERPVTATRCRGSSR